MAENQNNNQTEELDINHLMQIRRDKSVLLREKSNARSVHILRFV